MEIFNVLASLPIFDQTYNVELDWIGRFINWLVSSVGSVGLGIILFSLVLKLITLPFDVFQRISMRKQNQKMKANQERMEKLQKQYANDQDAYKQKVMEMYKENGMSVFSSCLPMILSLVIFIVAIGAFNSFATYSNVKNYNTLVDAYNESLTPYYSQITEENLSYETDPILDENGELKGGTVTYTVRDTALDNDNYVYYKAKYSVKKDKNGELAFEYDFNNAKKHIASADKAYYIDLYKVMNSTAEGAAKMQESVWSLANLSPMTVDENFFAKNGEEYVKPEAATVEYGVISYFTSIGQDAVKVAYDTKVKNDASFLWIKNIWETDATYKSPILEYDDFSTAVTEKGTCGCSAESNVKGMQAYSQDGYDLVTAKLSAEKEASNGYYILIALSIATILLQQFVSMRSQKEQQKFSSVDGQGAGQQKMMMIIMTAMFAIFSFMYSSAFSVYLIVSNVFSLISTLVINKLVDRKLNKQTEEAETKRYQNNALQRIEAAKNAGKQAANEKRGDKNATEKASKKKKK